MLSSSSAPSVLVAALLCGALGCSGKGESAAPSGVPALDSALTSDGTRLDTGFAFSDDSFEDDGLDEQPDNTLLLRHTGSWSLSPLGGPYRAVVGELIVEEFIDGDPDQPWCWVEYAMTGERVEDERADNCASCDFVFEVEFYLNIDGGDRPVDGADPIDTGGTYDARDLVEVHGREDCRSPELPADGERWLMGYVDGESEIYMEYFGTGIWLPWYAGELAFDVIEFAWVEEFGFVVPPDDEEE